ncbi:cyclin-P3-1 [Tanacetum coccineum]
MGIPGSTLVPSMYVLHRLKLGASRMGLCSLYVTFCLLITYPQNHSFFLQPCLDTEASTPENDEIYLTLGLKGRNNQKPGTPKVIALLSSILQETVEENEKLLKTTHTKDILTEFHGSRAPTLTIKQYVDRIFRYSRCSPSCFVVAYIYMDRFIQAENIILTSLNVHRLLITSIMIATKFIDEA